MKKYEGVCTKKRLLLYIDAGILYYFFNADILLSIKSCDLIECALILLNHLA